MKGMLAAIVLAGLAVGFVLPASAADGEVRVYTNADLEALPELPQQTPPETPGADLGWVIVQEFIDREHARIDADRRYELERRVVDAQVEALDTSRRDRYVFPFPGLFYGRGRAFGVGVPLPGGPHGGALPEARPLTQAERVRIAHRRLQGGGPIVPLHARPSGGASLRLSGRGRR